MQNFQIVDTDFSTGSFTTGGLWPGAFTIRAAGQFSPDPIALEATMPVPTTVLDVTLKLQPTSEVTGRILKPDGTPVGEGVLIKYKSDEFKTFCSESSIGEMSCTTIPQGIQEANAVTDAAGIFRFAVVNAGNYTLTAFEHADFTGRTARLRGSVRAGEKADVEFKLLGLADLDREGVRERRADPDSRREGAGQADRLSEPQRGAVQRPDRHASSASRASPAAMRSPKGRSSSRRPARSRTGSPASGRARS